jgi:hypothetical protein
MITGYIYDSGATFGMTQYTTHHIGMALFPPQFVLLHLPSINNIPHKIQSITGVVREEGV